MKTNPRSPFDHAADLPAAYEELRDALAAMETMDNLKRLDPGNIDVREIAECIVWQQADEIARAAARVAAAARRVKVAKVGLKQAKGWDGFTARRAA